MIESTEDCWRRRTVDDKLKSELSASDFVVTDTDVLAGVGAS